MIELELLQANELLGEGEDQKNDVFGAAMCVTSACCMKKCCKKFKKKGKKMCKSCPKR
ncbi:hypothetical protein [Roseivirga pacifica]|uniref:hypothetical protein n=1 Tax=Roseivirga pacifica TaxID=1267423 RepID=UPI002094F3AC|nr:hypothetical protein [Roseivirga pacifica]